MKDRWLKFWTAVGASGDPEAEWRSLSTRYGEPHRAYHTMDHIAHCLDELEEARDLAADPLAVEMALWYHDAVYDTRATDNEERSARMAVAAAVTMDLPMVFGASVAALILVSTHQSLPSASDAQLFADIDLSILGRPSAVFADYERRVRVEYGWVPEPAFRAARSAILKSFLERPSIYGTPHFRKKYEAMARVNLAVSLNQLR
jgi:predicted metal-dependent HD superfamily phosphohydrolase